MGELQSERSGAKGEGENTHERPFSANRSQTENAKRENDQEDEVTRSNANVGRAVGNRHTGPTTLYFVYRKSRLTEKRWRIGREVTLPVGVAVVSSVAVIDTFPEPDRAAIAAAGMVRLDWVASATQ